MSAKPNTEKGYVLPMVMITMMVVMILGMAIVNVSMTAARSGVMSDKKMQSYYIAKAGTEAVAQYMIDNPVAITMLSNKTSSPTSFGNGAFQVKVTPSVAAPATPTFYIVQSTGQVSAGTAAVTTTLSLKMFGNKDTGFTWGNSIWLENNS